MGGTDNVRLSGCPAPSARPWRPYLFVAPSQQFSSRFVMLTVEMKTGIGLYHRCYTIAFYHLPVKANNRLMTFANACRHCELVSLHITCVAGKDAIRIGISLAGGR